MAARATQAAKRPARAAKATTPAADKPRPRARKRSASRTPSPPKELSTVDRVRSDLKEMGPELENSALAGAALTLAADLDNPRNSATSHAMCAKALLDVMAQLRELAPPKKAKDAIDKIRAKDDRRRSRLRAVQ
jgi:hypothetical protein